MCSFKRWPENAFLMRSTLEQDTEFSREKEEPGHALVVAVGWKSSGNGRGPSWL